MATAREVRPRRDKEAEGDPSVGTFGLQESELKAIPCTLFRARAQVRGVEVGATPIN